MKGDKIMGIFMFVVVPIMMAAAPFMYIYQGFESLFTMIGDFFANLF